MGRGGIRKGAGRPKGTKDKKNRVRGKKLTKSEHKSVELFEQFNKKFYLKIKPYLTPEKRKEYESLMADGESALQCLKIILNDLMTRYKLGRIQEIQAGKTWSGITEVVNAIRQVAETIDKIETNRPELRINILSLIKNDKYKDEAKKISDKLFNLSNEEFSIEDVVEEDKKTVEDKPKDADKTVE